MSVKGGYHILNLQNKDLQYSPTIPNAYESVEGSYQKPILISGINIGGVEKADVYRMPVVSGSSYIFENVYGYDLTLTDSDGLSLASTQWATRSYVDEKATKYVHPLIIYVADTLYLTSLIFNDSAEPINTGDKLKSAIASFGGESFNTLMVTGSFKKDGDVIIASCLVHRVSDDKYVLAGVNIDGTFLATFSDGLDITSLTLDVQDAVNAI